MPPNRLLSLVGLLIVGCSGNIASSGDESDRHDMGNPGNTAGRGAAAGAPGSNPFEPGGTGGNPGTAPLGFAAPGVYRLTAAQYRNSLRDLLGQSVPLPTLDRDIVVGGFLSIGAASATISETAAESFEKGALAAAAFAFGSNGAARSAVACAAGKEPDAACARSFLLTFARKVFRRPLAAGEEAPYVKVWQDVTTLEKSGWRGIEFAVAALLQSPRFLFRNEAGEPDPTNPGRLRYSAHDMASRLSFFLWNSTPDDALLDAAGKGELLTPAGLAAQAKRLLDSPRAREALVGFVAEKLELGAVDLMTKDATAFPRYSASLPAAMKAETQRVIEAVLFDNSADYLDLLDTRTTFVNKELAAVYDIPGVTSSALVKTTLPADRVRRGILGHASFLASKAHVVKTSPTLRGKFVVERILCGSIPPPDANANTSIPNDPNLSMRDFLAAHRRDPICASCHKLMDPIGVAFESFDGIGALRTVDAGQPVDPSGDLDGKPYQDLRGLVALLREKPEVSACAVRDLYRFATGHTEDTNEQGHLDALTAAFESGGRRLPALVASLVTSDAFRFAAKP